LNILIEHRLGTAPYWMPVDRGWVEPASPVSVVQTPSTADLRQHRGVVIVDTLLASTILEQSLIAPQHAVTADRISLLTMVTTSRPDGVDEATVGVAGVSLTGRAVAEIVIPEFYGIGVREWTTDAVVVDSESIRVTEDVGALLPTEAESDFHEDLGRAWFLMTDTPYVSHVCLVDEESYQDDRSGFEAAMTDLSTMRRAADKQRRLLRRNISRDHDIDRELVVDVLDGLRYELTPESLEGLGTLYRQTGVLGRIGSLEERVIS
jgi:hypothetical protein